MSLSIAGYCRLSVDLELDKDNTSIEHQKNIISEYVANRFPEAQLTYYCDRDRSGYTFDQRENYQTMRRQLMLGDHAILIVKDFSRFARRNSKGLVELEDLRDAGVRIISIGDNIDYPTNDEWLSIQFRFLINEMPVTDTSKKIRQVVNHRKKEGTWICNVPYGYTLTDTKRMTIAVDHQARDVVRLIFDLYNGGWGYKKIANHLTQKQIPTPNSLACMRKEEDGESCKLKAKYEWSIVTIQKMLQNDFYIGTLRQNKWARKKINGCDVRTNPEEQIVFENHHEAIIDAKTFLTAQKIYQKRRQTNYRGIKKHENTYSGFLRCGDCGSPMFSMSRSNLAPAYVCGKYHRYGLHGCTSHHVRVDFLDTMLKRYLMRIKDSSAKEIAALQEAVKDESTLISKQNDNITSIETGIENARTQLKGIAKQKVLDKLRHPEQSETIDELYCELESELLNRIAGLENQKDMTTNLKNRIIQVNRVAKTVFQIFDDILAKEKLDKTDLDLLVEKIVVFEDHMDIQLKADITTMLQKPLFDQHEEYVLKIRNQPERRITTNIVSEGDPLEIFTDREGEVILKKYSPIGELNDFSREYAAAMHQNLGHIAAICDKDVVITVAGASRRELMDKAIHEDVEQVMQSRTKVMRSAVKGEELLNIIANDEENQPYRAQVIVPILAEGDAIGAVMLLSREPDVVMGPMEMKIAETAASFIGKQMEQ